jgi:hypothetical protein
MKKIIPFLFLCVSSHAQIFFENTYPNGGQYGKRLALIQLTASGHKYMELDTSQIILYNLNHTVFKTIIIPPQPNLNPVAFSASFVSEELFNTNPGDVEFILTYNTQTGIKKVRIYDENGNTLFSKDSAHFQPNNLNGGIVYTSAGVKMILNNQLGTDASVYSLPGILPCNTCTSGVVSGLSQQSNYNQQQLVPPFPNPTNTTTTITYRLPEGSATGEMVFYDLMGREIKRVIVTSAFSTVLITTDDLAAGTYYYELQTSIGVIPGNKIVVTE